MKEPSSSPNLVEIGHYISAISTSLRDTGMRFEESDGLHANAPKVMRDHLGPPMNTLPSFSVDEGNTRQPFGLGVFFDHTHAAMRLMGKHMGRFLSRMGDGELSSKKLTDAHAAIGDGDAAAGRLGDVTGAGCGYAPQRGADACHIQRIHCAA
ncbi:MAG: hypothetical protein K2Q01_08430 [Rickettsiales bacterium]|nr:hypothetical protein [Rickettsiales bacterium]